MEFQKSEYFQKRAHKFYPSISRGSRPLKRTQSSLSRDFCCLSISLYCLAISQLPRCLHQASFLHFHLSSLIFHRTHARKFPERLLSPSQRSPESFPTTPPEISRFLLPLVISTASRSSSGVISPFSSFFHRTRARKSSERLFSPSQRPPESHLKGFSLRFSVRPKVSRLCLLKSRDSQFGTKVIKILDLSLYLPPTRPFAVSPTLPYSPKPVLHQPRHQTESTSLVHQLPSTIYPHLILPYNNTHQSSSSLPTITKFAFPTGPSALLSFRSDWEFRTRRAGNCTEFEAVSTYVTLKK